jgi:hypothetical protein
MAKPRPKPRPTPAKAHAPPRRAGYWPAVVAALLAAGVGVVALNRKPAPAPSPTHQTNPAAQAAPSTNQAKPEPPAIEVNQALMVTVELDFGPKVPTIAEALRDIERRHQPSNGTGRVFAILDAYGEPTADGKKLHMSMHVSTERPGIGSLIFKPTGEVLWSGRVVPSTNAAPFSGSALTIYLDDGAGRMFTVDGSKNPASILDATIKEADVPIQQWWPEGAEREVTFIYSACGCPVKVMCRREGDRTVRTKEMPVIFPDDPSVVTLITRLMRW